MRKLPIILLTVLAWVVGANATILDIGADTTYTYQSLFHAAKAASNDDTLYVYESIQDTDSTTYITVTETGLTVYIPTGVTVTLADTASTAATTFQYFFTGENLTFTGGGTIKTHRAWAAIRADGYDINNITTEAIATGIYGSTSGLWSVHGLDPDDGAFTNCTFLGNDSLAIKPDAINFREVETATVSGCTFTDCRNGIVGSQTGGSGDWHGVTVTNCTFTDAQTNGIYLDKATCDTLVVTDCTFTGCVAAINIPIGATNVSIGDDDGVNDIFIYNGQPYGMIIAGINPVLSDIWIGGSTANNFHGLVLGVDGITAVGDTTVAKSIDYHGITFDWTDTTYMPNTLSNYHCIVAKDNWSHGYNISLEVPAAYSTLTGTLATFAYFKGAQTDSLTNCSINDRSGKVTALRVAQQGDSLAKDIVVHNIKAEGVFEAIAFNSDSCTIAVDNSYFSTSTAYDYDNSASMSLADSTWWGDEITYNSSSWRVKIGGATLWHSQKYDSRFNAMTMGRWDAIQKAKRNESEGILLVGIGQPWPSPKYAWSCWDDTLGNAGTRLPLFELIPAGASASQLLSIELNHNLFMAEADSALVDSVWIQGTVLDKSEIYPANDAPR